MNQFNKFKKEVTMMKLLKITLFAKIYFLLIFLLHSPCLAQKFSLGNPSGENIVFKSMENYMEIKLRSMNLPEVEEPPWYKKIFLNRKIFGLGYIEVKLGTKENSKKIKTMVFTYEKESENRYKYKSLGISPHTSASLSRYFPFPLQDQVQIRIVVKNFENEENIGFVKRILDMVKESGLDGLQTYSQVFTIATVAFGIIEKIFPPNAKDDEIIILISAEDITHKYHSILFRSEDNNKFEIFKLEFVPQPSLLPDLSFAEALKSDRIKRTDFWEEAIVNSTKLLDSKGITPLLIILRSFAKELRHSDLTYKDKVLFLAQAIHSWAPKAVSGFPYGDKFVVFNASNFRSIQLSAGDRKWLKETPWDFPGGPCDHPACTAVTDFIAKSVIKDESALQYIRKGFQLIIGDKTEFIQRKKYLEKISIIHDSEFKMRFIGGSFVFKFKQGALPIKYNNQPYNDKSINIFVNKDAKGYYVGTLEVL